MEVNQNVCKYFHVHEVGRYKVPKVEVCGVGKYDLWCFSIL